MGNAVGACGNVLGVFELKRYTLPAYSLYNSMGLFGQAKDLYKLQKQAKKIKEELRNLHIEAEGEGVVVIINGEQEVVEVRISEEAMKPENQAKLQTILLTVFNKAIKKSQEVAAERMRGMMGDLGMDLPGLGAGEKPQA